MTWRSLLRVVARRIVFGTDSPGRATGDSSSDDHPSFREVEVGTWPDTRADSLERTLDRAESMLDGQLSTLTEIDEKALRTVRLSLILLGVVVSIAGIAPGPVPINAWTKSSIVLLVCSIVSGIFAYSTSPPDFGPGPRYVHSNFASGDADDEMYLELLHGYEEAISHNRNAVTDSARYLFVVQTSLVGSIVVGFLGVLLVS